MDPLLANAIAALTPTTDCLRALATHHGLAAIAVVEEHTEGPTQVADGSFGAILPIY